MELEPRSGIGLEDMGEPARGDERLERMSPDEQADGQASPTAAGTKKPPTDGPTAKAKIAGRKRAVLSVKQALRHPVSFEVTYANGAHVREEPCEDSPEVMSLPKGSVLEGFFGQDWLEIKSASAPSRPSLPAVVGKWVHIGARLRATCLRMRVTRTFAEAVDVSWDGLSAHETWRVKYGLKWRLSQGQGAADEEGAAPAASSTVGAPRHDFSSRPEGMITGLLPGQEIRFAVVAQLPGGAKPQKISGPWTSAIVCPELDLAARGALVSIGDAAGRVRGGCKSSGCLAWVAPLERDQRCARCGHAADEHELLPPGQRVQMLAPEVAIAWPPLQHFQLAVEREVDIRDWPHSRAKVLGQLQGRGLSMTGYKYGDWVNVERGSLVDQFPSTEALWIRCSRNEEAELAPVSVIKDAAAPAAKGSDGNSSDSDDDAAAAEAAEPTPGLARVVVDTVPAANIVIICGYTSSPWLTDLLEIHPEISLVRQTDFLCNIARMVDDADKDFPTFRQEVLRLASAAADFDEQQVPSSVLAYLEAEEAAPPRPSLSLEFVLEATHHFLDEIRAGRPRLPAFGRLAHALLEEYAQMDGARKVIVWEPPDCLRVLPLLGAACPNAKVVHCVGDGRDVARRAAGSSEFRSVCSAAERWIEAVEAGVSWGFANEDRYMEVRCEDAARRPSRELSRALSFVGVEASSERQASELIGKRRKAAPSEDEDGTDGTLDSPRLQRYFNEGRLRSALLHFGYGGDGGAFVAAGPALDAVADPCRKLRPEDLPDLQEPFDRKCSIDSGGLETPPSGKAGSLVQGKLLFRNSLDLQAVTPSTVSTAVGGDSPAWTVSPTGAWTPSSAGPAAFQRRATVGTLGSGTRTPPGITSSMKTPRVQGGIEKANTTAFGADCTEELASILQRRLARAEPQRGEPKTVK